MVRLLSNVFEDLMLMLMVVNLSIFIEVTRYKRGVLHQLGDAPI